MPLRLEIKKKFSSRSERVKSVDFHSQEPWILAALYSGHVFIWNHQTQATVKTLEVCDLPVRCAKFVDRKQWVVCGADDLQIRVYNYNTMERIKTFEAHTDYIRCIAVHPTLPYLLTSSDDMSIKLWDWEKGWECQTIFEGHTHYVMQVEFNPKDSNTFASASLDRTVKIWGLNSPNPHFSLEGHERGVNCVAYFRGGDRPYLMSGADDNLVKIWDYQTKTCVATLEGHTNNVSAVSFHPTLPIILTGAEDGTVRIWHSTTYRLENTLNYGMERVWSIACLRGSNRVAIGYDEGTVMIKIGHEEPVVSMEKGGKIVWAKNNEIVIANVKKTNLAEVADGDRLPVQTKELGSCEVYPQSIKHNPNGRLLCVCGDGEYIIYTALSLKNTSFGTALEFVWSTDSGVYGTRESTSKVKVFKNFKEHKAFRPTFVAEGIFGGALLGVRSSDFIDMYDWNECRIVRRIDVCPRKVYWSDSGDVVVLCCDTSYYVLRYNAELVQKFFDQSVEVGEQGIEGAFELEQEISEKVRNGSFVGDCFLYTNSAGRLNYYVGGEVMTLAHLPKSMYLMGYLAKENRVYLMDKQYNLYTYSLLVSVLVYQTAIVRQDFDQASKALAQIPDDQHNKIARFLEAQDLKDMALQVSKDPEHRFELAMQCKKLHVAREIVVESESEQKWRQLGDAALNQDFDLKLAEECFTRCKDLGSLLLLYTSVSDRQGIASLAEMAKESGHNNVAFLCYFQLGRLEDCVNLLCDTGRIPEAAFLARTYLPSHVPRILDLWKQDLRKVSKNAAESLADPREFKDMFPNLETALSAEQYCVTHYKTPGLAAQYPVLKAGLTRDLLAEVKEGKLNVPAVRFETAFAAAASASASSSAAAAPTASSSTSASLSSSSSSSPSPSFAFSAPAAFSAASASAPSSASTSAASVSPVPITPLKAPVPSQPAFASASASAKPSSTPSTPVTPIGGSAGFALPSLPSHSTPAQKKPDVVPVSADKSAGAAAAARKESDAGRSITPLKQPDTKPVEKPVLPALAALAALRPITTASGTPTPNRSQTSTPILPTPERAAAAAVPAPTAVSASATKPSASALAPATRRLIEDDDDEDDSVPTPAPAAALPSKPQQASKSAILSAEPEEEEEDDDLDSLGKSFSSKAKVSSASPVPAAKPAAKPTPAKSTPAKSTPAKPTPAKSTPAKVLAEDAPEDEEEDDLDSLGKPFASSSNRAAAAPAALAVQPIASKPAPRQEEEEEEEEEAEDDLSSLGFSRQTAAAKPAAKAAPAVKPAAKAAPAAKPAAKAAATRPLPDDDDDGPTLQELNDDLAAFEEDDWGNNGKF